MAIERRTRKAVQRRMNRTPLRFLLPTVVFVLSLAVAVTAAPSEKELQKEAKITKNQAEHLALTKVPNGIVKTSELEREKGLLIWSFDIAKPGTKDIAEVQIDARTGKVISVQTETPADQKKEASADKARK